MTGRKQQNGSSLNINGDDEQSNSAVTLPRRSQVNNATSWVGEPPVEYVNSPRSSSEDEDERTVSDEQAGSDVDDEAEEFSADNSSAEESEEENVYEEDEDDENENDAPHRVDGSLSDTDYSSSDEVPAHIRDIVREHLCHRIFGCLFPADTILPTSFLRVAIRAVTTMALLIEPFYSLFLWQSAVKAIAETTEAISGYTMTPFALNVTAAAVLPFVLANLACDLFSVLPQQEADEWIYGTGEIIKSKIKRALGIGLIVTAIGTSYPVGAAADAIPVSAFMHKYFPNDQALINTIQYGALGISGFLGIIYYSMFTNPKIGKHASEFIDCLAHPLEFLNRVRKNPGKYFEVGFQALSNAAYRAISFEYTAGDVIATFGNFSSTSPTAWAIRMTTLFTTGLVTVFSRTTPVRDKFVTLPVDAEHKIVAQAWEKASGLKGGWGLTPDVILTSIRSLCASYLTFYFLPGSDAIKLTAAITIGSLLALHGAWTRYWVNRAARAKEITAQINSGHYRNIPTEESGTWEEMSLINVGGLSPLYTEEVEEPNSEQQSTEQKEEKNPEKTRLRALMKTQKEMFEILAKDRLSPSMKTFISVLNTMARSVRLVAFYLFVNDLLKDIVTKFFPGYGAVPLQIVATLAAFWGAEIFKNDGELYQQAIEEVVTYYSVVYDIQKNIRAREYQEQETKPGTPLRAFYFLKDTGKMFVSSIYDFAPEDIEYAIQQAENSNIRALP